MNGGTDEANPDFDPPSDPSDDGLSKNTISNADGEDNCNEDNSDSDKGDDEDEHGDSDAGDGPTIEAYVDLAKRACKLYFSGYSPIHMFTYIYSVQSLS
jgi:hypothetical protein